MITSTQILAAVVGCIITLVIAIHYDIRALRTQIDTLRSELKEQEEETDAKLRLIDAKHGGGGNPF